MYLKQITISIAICFSSFCWGQEENKVKVQTKYFVSTQSKKLPLKVRQKLNPNQYKYETTNRHISTNGDTILVQKIKTKYSNLTDIDTTLFKKYPKIKVSVKQDESNLILNPHPFEKGDSLINNYLKDKEIVLPIKNGYRLGIPIRTTEFGALTIPVKVYLNSRDERLKNNFLFDESINFRVSKIRGKEYFYKKFNEKEGKSFQYYFTYSLFVGFSKTEINNSNTLNEIDDDFTVASLNYGVGFGYSIRGIGLSLLLGIDTPLSEQANNWNFKNQPWLGFGFGIDL